MKKVATILYGGISGKSLILTTLLLIFTGWTASAQFVITYPGTAQQPLTVCYGQSTLTVRVDAAVVSSNNIVTIQLPTGVEYVAGSVAKTAGTASLIIAESNIANLNAPVFAISPAALAASDNITFSIARVATCAARTWALAGNAFRDITTVTGSVGSKSYTPVVGYNVDYSSFSMVQPIAITDAVVGGTYTRTFTVKNGASGSAGHVYLYIEYPSAGIELQLLTLGGNTLIPTSVAGDRLNFDITGTLLGADALFSNGEALTFTENIKVKKCGANTLYGTGWGSSSNPSTWCQSASGTGAVTMATGTPDFTTFTSARVNFVDACTPFTTRYTFKNGGAGNTTAAGMYNVSFRLGQSLTGVLSAGRWNFIRLLFCTIGSASGLTVTNGSSEAIASVNLANLLTSDPDGAGTGLDDLDGDGYYDDLPAGATATLDFNTSVNCSLFTCNQNWSTSFQHSADIQFSTMCNPVIQTSTVKTNTGAGFNAQTNQLADKSYAPANIYDAIPFRARFSVGYYALSNPFDNVQTRYEYDITLPAGVSVSGTGNPRWYSGKYPDNYSGGGTAVSYTQAGNVVTIRSPNQNMGYFEIDMVLTCGTTNPSGIPYNLRRLDNVATGCICNDMLFCGTMTIANVVCLGSCTKGGPSLTYAKVERTDGSLGWTDNTLSTHQIRSAISDYDLSKALYLDEISLTANAVQQTISSTNLYVKFKIKKLGSTGNKLTPMDIAVSIKRGGVSVASGTLTTFGTAGTSNSIQVTDWNLSSLIPSLPGGSLQPGDIIETSSRYIVSDNNFPTHDVQTGENLYIYNLDASNNEVHCNSLTPELYLVSPVLTDGSNNPSFQSCTTMAMGNATHYIAYRFDATGTKFLNEVRPGIMPVKLTFTVPEGYNLINVSWQGTDAVFSSEPLVATLISGSTYEVILPPKTHQITVSNWYASIISVNLQPTCATVASGTLYSGTIEYIPYYYHYKDLAVKPTATMTKSLAASYLMSTKPTINLTNQTGTIQAYQPQHNWTVRMANPSSSTAPYTWLGIPAKASINVVSVTDVATGTPLTPITYSSGTWYQISSTGLAAGSYKDYRIDFTYTSCNNDYLTVIGGWNCSTFPTDPTAYTCGNNAINLAFNPQVSEVELTADILPPANVDLCTLIDYAYHITSVQAGNTTNNKINLKCPTGMNPVPGSFEVEYPFGADNWAAITPVVSGDDHLYDLTTHPAYPARGLPGTLATPVTANRQMGIRFKMNTNCSFVANTNFSIDATANRPCGEAAIGNGLVVQGPSTGINGINPAYQTINVLSSTDMLNCSQQATITVKSTVVAGTTGTGDVMKISLPKGISMIPGSFTQIDGGSVSYTGSTTLPTGITELHYQIPAGLNGGDHMEFSIKVIDGVETTCGTNRIDVQTSAIFENVACGTLFCPTVGGETGKGGVDFIDRRPQIDVSSASGCLNPATNNYDVNFTLDNSGTSDLLAANPFTLKFYCNDGTGNPTGAELATFSQGIDINMGGTYTGSISFARPVCANGLVAVVSKDDNCVCATSAKGFRVTELFKPAINTGAPTCSAGGTASVTNTESGATYTFNPTGPSVGAGGVISSLKAGQNYTVTASKDGCTSPASDSFSVQVTLPTPTAPTANDLSVCFDGQSHTASATVNPGETIVWYDAAIGGSAIATPTISSVGTVTYYAQANANIGGCSSASRTAVQLTIYPLPESAVTKTDVTCFNASNGSLTITVLVGTSPYTFSIDNGSTYPYSGTSPKTISNLSPGTFKIRVKDKYGCESLINP